VRETFMFSFDLSTMNIILTVTVAGLFILFIYLLMKLKPSAEEKEDFKTEVETREPRQPIPIVTQAQNPPPAKIEVPRPVEKPLLAVGPSMRGPPIQTKQEPQMPPPTTIESKEALRPPDKTIVQTKTGFVPAKGDCLHHFGYLRTFPKNSPIPDECFGCEKIVDCLVSKKSNKNSK